MSSDGTTFDSCLFQDVEHGSAADPDFARDVPGRSSLLIQINDPPAVAVGDAAASSDGAVIYTSGRRSQFDGGVGAKGGEGYQIWNVRTCGLRRPQVLSFPGEESVGAFAVGKVRLK